MRNNSKTVMLNYPPVSSVWHLPAGMGMIAGYLSQKGHKVIQRYGHIEGLEWVLEEFGGDSVSDSLRIMRCGDSTIRQRFDASKMLEDVALSVSTEDAFGVQRNNVIYVSEHYDGTVEGLLEAIDQKEESLWYDYFRERELPIVDSVRPNVYGISISDERQLMPGMILASMVKESLPDTKVVVGGNFWSRIASAFRHPEFKKLFRYCDGITYREGFKPLDELVETLQPRHMSGTAWLSDGEVVMNPPTETAIGFEELPTPVFDRQVRQWSADFVPQLYTMSNCPMQCGFCAISAGSDTFLKSPRAMSPKKVARIMAEIGAHRFEIADETFPVNRQLAVGEELRKIGYDATWNCYLTITNDLLDPERCRKLYEAGCRGVQLGLESLSRDTLLREVKSWNHPENYGKILRNLSEEGMQNHVFLLMGLPGESLQAGLRWLPFLEEHGEDILTIKAGRYRLTKSSPEEMYDTHSSLIQPSSEDKPLHLNRNFRYLDKKTSRKRVEAVRDLLEQACRNHWAYSVTSTLPWWANRGMYSVGELREMSKQLPAEPEVNHLDRSISKARGIIGKTAESVKSYHDLVDSCRNI